MYSTIFSTSLRESVAGGILHWYRDTNAEGFTGKVTLESKRPVGAGDDSADHGSRSEADKKGKGRAGVTTTCLRVNRPRKGSRHPSTW
jgi:hypothetical protein